MINEHRSFRGGCPVGGTGPGDLRLRLAAGGGGKIINVSSVHGRQPSGVNVDYGAAKAAMINLTKALAEEFGPQGIHVGHVVIDGGIDTAFIRENGDLRQETIGPCRFVPLIGAEGFRPPASD